MKTPKKWILKQNVAKITVRNISLNEEVVRLLALQTITPNVVSAITGSVLSQKQYYK